MQPFISDVQTYNEHHQKQSTRYMHLSGSMLVIFSLMIFFSFFHLIVPTLLDVNLAEIGTLILLIYYVCLTWRLGLPLIPVFTLLVWLANIISRMGFTRFPLWCLSIIFLLGVLLVLISYFIEKKPTSLRAALSQMLIIAPLYLMAELFFAAGWMDSLKKQIKTFD